MFLRVTPHIAAASAVALLGLGSVAAASAVPNGPPLPIGEITAGEAGEGGSVYSFTATEPGVLTVVIQGEDDLMIDVTDANGTELPDGHTDSDLFDDMGSEQLAVTIPAAGDYLVTIASPFGSGTAIPFEIAASWVAFPSREREPDTDGGPSVATVLEAGQTHEDPATTETDENDWFTITASAAGTLTVATEPLDPTASRDLTLQLYAAEDLEFAVASSDNDIDGIASRESLTYTVTAGQTVFIEVHALWGGAGSYRLTATLS